MFKKLLFSGIFVLGLFALADHASAQTAIPGGPIVFSGNASSTGGGGGSGTVTNVSTDATLTGGPCTTTCTLGIDLTHANTWSGQQTFVAPVLGSIASGNLANGTGYTVSNLAGLGTGVATFLATPSSANLFSALTTKTGSGGSVVFATGPTVSALTVTGSLTATGLVTNADLANSTISGVALGGTLGALTATNSTLTFSGSYTGTAAQTVGLNLSNANTWAAVQTFTNSDIKLLGSSTGATTFTSANSGASNFTLTVPAVTDTLALIGIGSVISSNGTTTSPTAAQFNNNFPLYTVDATTAVFNIPSAATLQANGGGMEIINWTGNTYTLTPNGTDQLCVSGGSCTNSSATIAADTIAIITSNGTKDYVVTSGSGGSFTGGNVANATNFQANGAASTPTLTISGTIFSGGTGTTTSPKVYINCTGATAVAGFSTSGTAFGINACTGVGNLMDLYNNGTESVVIDGSGNAIFASVLVSQTNCLGFLGASCLTSSADGFIDNFKNNKTTYGAFKSAAYINSGATPTITGTCTSGTKTGGNTAGRFVVSCTAQTIILTFATTAPTGWNCEIKDLTTIADVFNQASSTQTSCTFSSTTTAASDAVKFVAVPY